MFDDAILFERATRGWRCTLGFRVSTRRQYTMEVHNVAVSSKFLFIAFIKAKFAKRNLIRELQALPGEYKPVSEIFCALK